MGAKLEYQIVGRYMNGAEVTGYHVQNLEKGEAKRFSRDLVLFLVGRGQITNCTGQPNGDKVVLRGVGMTLDSLPVQQENGQLSKTEAIGKVRRGATAADAMTQVMVTTAIVDGRRTVGYIVANAGGGTNKISRQQAFQMAKEGKIGNCRYQESNGTPILRGVGLDLNKLPTITAEEAGVKSAAPAAAPVAAVATTPVAPKRAPAPVAAPVATKRAPRPPMGSPEQQAEALDSISAGLERAEAVLSKYNIDKDALDIIKGTIMIGESIRYRVNYELDLSGAHEISGDIKPGDVSSTSYVSAYSEADKEYTLADYVMRSHGKHLGGIKMIVNPGIGVTMRMEVANEKARDIELQETEAGMDWVVNKMKQHYTA